MLQSLGSFAVLFGVWLLWSGHLEPLMIAFGVASCAAVVALATRFGCVGFPEYWFALRALVAYGPWLLWQIAKANLSVARTVLTPRLPIAPQFVRVPVSQRTGIGQTTYANSITLTPGTISLDVRDGTILVHALTGDAAAELRQGEMDRRVTELESALP